MPAIDMIHVRPAPACRVEFARWAVAQRPKIRTVDPQTFAVPPRLFTAAPERILIGSTVDGHRYVSPVEDEQRARKAAAKRRPPRPAQARRAAGERAAPRPAPPTPAAEPEPAPGPDRLLGVATPEGLDADEATPPAPATNDGVQDEPHRGAEPYACDLCDRSFTTERGRATHRRRVHREA